MKCELKPIAKDEAYRVLRELVLRMDLTAQEHPKESLEELKEAVRWAGAIDKLMDGLDLMR